jgi:16S rRNA (adenine1518-N6/adenine1519-N6)-dimethyltransferase
MEEGRRLGELAKPSVIIGILKERGIGLSRRYGQHFLVDGNILARIVEAADLQPDDTVFEVGAGAGTLTEELCARAGRVWAVEQDPRFFTLMQDYFRDTDNLILRQADVLDLDLFTELPAGGPLKMVSNLPYNVATAVLLKSLRELPWLESLVVLVQREMAQRYLAAPGSRSYGIPTLKLNYYCRISKVMQVPPSVFLPPPRIDSTLLRLERREDGAGRVQDTESLFRLIDAAFSQRRKTLVNSLAPHFQAEGGKALLTGVVGELGWEAGLRPEELTLDDFIALHAMLPGPTQGLAEDV